MGFLASLLGRGRIRASSSAMAMPLFGHSRAPNVADALGWVRERFADSPAFGEIEGADDIVTVDIPGGTLGFAHVASPVPASDLKEPLEQAWHWPEAAAVVKAHQAHVVCFGGSKALDIIDIRLLHSRVIAGLLATGDGCGVYVGDARLVKSAELYIEDILESSRQRLPIPAWIGFNLILDEGAQSAYTTGLTEFGLLELEVRQSKLPWADLVGTLTSVAHYQIASNLKIAERDSPAERHRLRHARSEFMRGAKVALVDT